VVLRTKIQKFLASRFPVHAIIQKQSANLVIKSYFLPNFNLDCQIAVLFYSVITS